MSRPLSLRFFYPFPPPPRSRFSSLSPFSSPFPPSSSFFPPPSPSSSALPLPACSPLARCCGCCCCSSPNFATPPRFFCPLSRPRRASFASPFSRVTPPPTAEMTVTEAAASSATAAVEVAGTGVSCGVGMSPYSHSSSLSSSPLMPEVEMFRL